MSLAPFHIRVNCICRDVAEANLMLDGGISVKMIYGV